MEGLGIGLMARRSGLTVSALRFYDGAGVLGPAHVDPRTGYRRYAPEQVVVARLVATLRRVGIPLGGIRAVLAGRHDPDAVDALVAAHLRRLEQGVADARRELSGVRSLLAPEENPVLTLTVPAAALADALRAVRFAVGSDPAFPVLGGVLLDVADGVLTVVATDRYRLAVSAVPVPGAGSASAVVAAADADRLAALGPGAVELRVGDGTVRAGCGDTVVEATALPDAFPDHRRLIPSERRRPIAVDAGELRAAVAAGGTRPVVREPDGVETAVTVLSVDAAGRLVVGPGEEGTGVNAEFLLEALDAGGPGQLLLELDGPLAPVAIRPCDRTGTFSLLMPVLL